MNYTENDVLSTYVDQLIELLDEVDETLNPKFYDESGIQREVAPEETKCLQFGIRLPFFKFGFGLGGKTTNGNQCVTPPSGQQPPVPADRLNPQGPPCPPPGCLPSGGNWVTLPSGQQAWVPASQQPQGPVGSTNATAISTAHGGDANATAKAISEYGNNANATATATSKGGNANATSEATSKRYGSPMPTRSQMPNEEVQSSGYSYSESSFEGSTVNSSSPNSSVHPALVQSYQRVYKTLKDLESCVNHILYNKINI